MQGSESRVRARRAHRVRLWIALPATVLLSACGTPNGPPPCSPTVSAWASSVPDVELRVWGPNGDPIRICWSDDALYTTPTPECGPWEGSLIPLKDVVYEVYHHYWKVFDVSEGSLFAEVRADLAMGDVWGCNADEEFRTEDDTRWKNETDFAETHAYMVCRTILGDGTACSNVDYVEWVTPLGGPPSDSSVPPPLDAGTPDASADAGVSDAGGICDASGDAGC